MKLPSEKNSTIETSEQFKEASFGIRSIDMGLIIEILRSKMYSDPIATICQEIASNARDANREVGKKNKPIKISLVDSLFRLNEIDLVIEDDGPGISPERMNEIFIYYGASTKRDTNTQTGGYGLGCKTPFAYADTFSVVTRCEGKKYSYQAVIESNRSGKVFLTHTEPTTEGNGTAIIIPVKSQDVRRFSEECYRTTFFWKVKPIYAGLKIPDSIPLIIKEDDRVVIAENSLLYSRAGYFALVDSIPYHLDYNLLNFTSLSKCSIFFKFKTGNLSIAASRESLHYDDKTKKALKDVYEEFVKDELTKLTEKVNTAVNELQAKLFRAEILNGPYHDILRNRTVMWKDKKVSAEFESMKLYRVEQFYVGHAKRPSGEMIPHNLLNTPCVEMDLQKFTLPRNTTLLKNHKYFYVVAPLSAEKKQEYEDFKQLLGGKIPLYSEVPYIREKRDNKLEINEIRCHTLSWRYRWRTAGWATPQTYLISELAKIKAMYVVLPKIRDLTTENAVQYFLTQEASDYKVFIIRPKFVEAIKNICTPYEVVLKTVEKEFQELSLIMKSKSFPDLGILRSLDFKEGIKKDLNYLFSLQKKASSDHKIWRLAGELSDSHVLTKYPVTEDFKKAEQTHNDLLTKYPLLKHLTTYAGSSERQEFSRYITLIDKEDEQVEEPQLAMANI